MKKVICMFAMLVMVGILCAGCNDTDASTPETPKQSETTKDKNWAPEMAEEPATACEHEGHDHDPGDGHSHDAKGHDDHGEHDH